MNPNTHSVRPSDGVAALTMAVDSLATQNLDGLSDAVRAERVLQLRRLVDRREGHWLNELAAVDAGGAAGAEEDVQAGSTAGWLRGRLRMGAAAASHAVRTARALFAGPLPQTGQALTAGDITPAHAAVLAHGTHDLPAQVTAEADPVRWRRPGGWTRPGCDRSWAISSCWPTPTAPPAGPSGATSGGACGWPRPWRAWWRSVGCWSPRPARPCWPPWTP